MKFTRTNLPIGMTILLALLTVVLAVIVVPFLLVVVVCWLARGISGGFFSAFSSDRKDAPSNIQGRNHAPRDGNADERASSGDDTIECEVISARTIDENGQEIS